MTMMKSRRIAAAVLFSFLAHGVALPASAQDDPTTKQARARFQEGVEFYDKGQYDNARASFLQAYALKKHPAVLLNLAQSSLKAGHPLEASQYFQQYLKEATTATPAQRKDAESGLAEARQKIGRIEIVAPAGTQVTLDDKDRLGPTPLAEPVDVEPGPHTLKSSTETVNVIATVGQVVQARFGGAATPAAAAVPAPLPKEAGEPTATAEPASDTTPPPAADRTKKTDLLSPPENMTPVWIGVGAGAVGLVGAIVFAAFKADAQSKADAVADEIRSAAQARGIPSQGVCNSTNPSVQRDFANACATLQDNNDKVDTNALVANVSLGVMGAGLVFAAGWYLFAPKRDEGRPAAARTFVTPYGGYGNAGLNVSGSF